MEDDQGQLRVLPGDDGGGGVLMSVSGECELVAAIFHGPWEREVGLVKHQR